jgi:hypothetical protein
MLGPGGDPPVKPYRGARSPGVECHAGNLEAGTAIVTLGRGDRPAVTLDEEAGRIGQETDVAGHVDATVTDPGPSSP